MTRLPVRDAENLGATDATLGKLPDWDLTDLYPAPDAPEIARDLAEVEAWLALRRAKPIRRAPPPDVRKRITRPVRAADRNEGRPFPG